MASVFQHKTIGGNRREKNFLYRRSTLSGIVIFAHSITMTAQKLVPGTMFPKWMKQWSKIGTR
jgi:hypothetical protein